MKRLVMAIAKDSPLVALLVAQQLVTKHLVA